MIPQESVDWQEDVRRAAHNIRMRVLHHTVKSNGGYLSQACSSSELFATLYMRIMKLAPSEAPMIPEPFPGVPGPNNLHFFNGGVYNGPQRPDLDRFIFSPAHYALVLYSTLIEVGRMAPAGLEMFNQDGSTVEMIGAEHSPGVETTTGSLGQALSQAAGIALARRLRGDSGRVWVLMTDGEFQEGQVWEALATIAYYKLDNLGIYVDVNRQQCDGAVEDVMSLGSLKGRLESFGARVFEVDGHDPAALAAPADLPPDGRMPVVLAFTDPCRGIGILQERAPNLHYVRFKSEDERNRYRQLYEVLQQR